MNEQLIGWLVCIEGPNKGMDYRLTREGNTIGGQENNTVCIPDDEAISPYAHATINFDLNCGKSYISAGFGKRIVKVNNAIVFSPMYLKPYDRISIGSSEFAFIPFGGVIDTNNTWNKVRNKQPVTDILTDLKDCVVSPVVGWLVNRNMDAQGVSYRLTAEYNYFGRSAAMTISLPNDSNIMEENHAAIVYDAAENTFYFVPLNGNTGFFINGMPANIVAPLVGYEEISIGATRLCFIPFCGDYFRW